jgi:phenylalanyl-tRNA synthetase beta chain
VKFSYNWIRELVRELETPAIELEHLITMKTAECEGIESFGGYLSEAVSARVESVEPIPGSHNVKAVVQTGRYGRRTVVCGAPNCRPGMITAYAPIGKKLIHGIESDGMLASAAELGINRDAAGIIELDIQVGAPMPGCVPDHIIDIDNKSITHRPDLWGHLGMAREVAAISRKALIDPIRLELVPSQPAPVNVVIEDLTLCPRYSALVFENVAVRPSPHWLQCRLTAIGLNPINNIVDTTNFVMAELAQPMHAFDRNRLRGSTIFVRPARPGERFIALNDEEYTLDPSNLVIADEGGAIALAGVIGGRDSAINDETTSIVLESANFNAASIRRTSSAIRLRTDASMRFEKSQDPENTVRGLARAAELLQELSPGIRPAGGLADTRQPARPAPVMTLPLEWLNRKLGRSVPPAEVRDILERLSFQVSEPERDVFVVQVPSWRATKDISTKDDLVEEVGRMVGYDSIAPQAPQVASIVPPRNERRAFEHSVRSMAAAQGFTEVYNYSFITQEQAVTFGYNPADLVRVANPIAEDQALLRPSLVPGIWKNIVENSRHLDTFRLFELGHEIHKTSESLPNEIPHFAAAFFGKDDTASNLFELKRLAECLMDGATVEPAEARNYEHPARTGEVYWRGTVVGRLFELYPSMVENGRAAVLDLNVAKMQQLRPAQKAYTPVRRYPSSAFDLSVIAGARELAGDLEKRLAEFAGDLLERIEYLREYQGPPLADGTKSVSFRLTLGSPQRTLDSEEVRAVRERIIEGMRKLGYELRL